MLLPDYQLVKAVWLEWTLGPEVQLQPGAAYVRIAPLLFLESMQVLRDS